MTQLDKINKQEQHFKLYVAVPGDLYDNKAAEFKDSGRQKRVELFIMKVDLEKLLELVKTGQLKVDDSF